MRFPKQREGQDIDMLFFFLWERYYIVFTHRRLSGYTTFMKNVFLSFVQAFSLVQALALPPLSNGVPKRGPGVGE